MRRGLLVLDRHLAFIRAFDRRNADLHDGLELIRRHFVHAFATRHALRDNFGVEQDLPDPIPRRVERVIAFELQAKILPDSAAVRHLAGKTQLPKKHNVHPGKKQPLATRLNTREQRRQQQDSADSIE